MSTKRKRDDDKPSVVGYIKNVSPVKMAQSKKTRYFLAELDTSKEQTDKVVCFSPEKHPLFTSAMKSASAFELRNVKIVPGQHQNEIKCWQDCEVLKTTKSLDFDKTYTDFQKKEEVVTGIKNVQEFQLVTVEAKVLSISDERIVDTKYGPRPVTDIQVGDQTDSIQLQAWGSEITRKLEKQQSYRITNLTVKEFNKKKIHEHYLQH